MPIKKLDHVNLRTTQLDTMIDWYTTILGLHNGYRGASTDNGAWLYAGDDAIVHLVEMNDPAAIGSEASLKLEHFAFTATDIAGLEARLQAAGVDYKRSDQPANNLSRINVWDPDGNHIHIDFAADS